MLCKKELCDSNSPSAISSIPLRARRESQLLHEGDAEHIRTDQQRETTNGKGKVDLIHGDLSETASFDWL